MLKAILFDFDGTLADSRKVFGKDRLLLKFLKENQLSNSEVLYVGDEQRDIVACKKVAEPDYKVYEPAEILQVVQSSEGK